VADAAAQVREAWARIDACDLTGDLDAGVAAHAPYSTSPALCREVARCSRSAPLTVHLAESAEERQFLRTGSGPFRDLLDRLGAWDRTWEVPSCGPVEYLQRLGYLQPGMLAVHGVHLTDDELEHLRRARAVLVTCPRSNAWVGGGLPRLTHFYGSRVPVAVGTDSLASSPSLSVFDELAEMRRIAPTVAAAAFLDSATRVGARALGWGREYGTLASGARAAFALVDLPPDVDDVEEYLVSGVPATAVRPLSVT
jgi:cytosine/adenosine deaminase-related metal-dependent hydrolase